MTAFSSDATTPDGVLSDLWSYAVQRERDAGRIDATDAVTKATSLPHQDAGSFASSLNELYDSRAQKFGGGSMNPLEYARQRRDFIAQREGVSPFAYDDSNGQLVANQKPTGNVTVGIGFNMDRKDARDVWDTAGVTEDFDKVYRGQLGLSQASTERLFSQNALEAEQVVGDRTKGITLNDHQRLALVSMAFNGPSLIGSRLTDALKTGNRISALNEILFNSNGANNPGLARRRYAEAAQFAGADAQRVLPDYNSYLSSHA